MKKSIAFLGALLFGSVTFGQVTKNDSINKSTSRKVSAEDMKKFPEDIESTTNAEAIKGESKHKSDNSASVHKGGTYKNSSMQKSSDNSARSGTIQGEAFDAKHPRDYKKPSDNKSTTTEKQHYTIKMTNANKKAAEDVSGQVLNDESATSMQKKHVANVKWTHGKVAKDSLPTPASKTSSQFIKITDIKGEKEK